MTANLSHCAPLRSLAWPCLKNVSHTEEHSWSMCHKDLDGRANTWGVISGFTKAMYSEILILFEVTFPQSQRDQTYYHDIQTATVKIPGMVPRVPLTTETCALQNSNCISETTNRTVKCFFGVIHI